MELRRARRTRLAKYALAPSKLSGFGELALVGGRGGGGTGKGTRRGERENTVVVVYGNLCPTLPEAPQGTTVTRMIQE